MREVGGATASSFAAGGVSETELLAYVARVGLSPMIPGVSMMPAVPQASVSERFADAQMQAQMQTSAGGRAAVRPRGRSSGSPR